MNVFSRSIFNLLVGNLIAKVTEITNFDFTTSTSVQLYYLLLNSSIKLKSYMANGQV